MEKRAQPLSTDNRVQVINEYANNVIKMDMAKELLEEEENKVMERRTGSVSYTHLDVYKRQDVKYTYYWIYLLLH